ncbi:MAG: hypothetical protein K0R80_3269 [Clostridia bacterium]|jgi:hypothetical protein|nr:hypothetical protein [Clostridia bacterium]
MKGVNGQSGTYSTGLKSTYTSVFWLGGIACIILIAYSLATMIIVALVGPPPQTASEAFDILINNKILGLLRLDILTVFVMPLYYILFYSIYIALKKTDSEWATISTLLVFAGVTLFLATPSVFSYLHLSNQYAIAETEMQKVQLLAAGEAVVASDMWHGTGALIGGLLLQTGTLLISFVMLKSKVFSKLTAWVGIVMHGLDLAHIVMGFFLPILGVFMMGIAGTLYLLWFPLIGAQLFRLSKEQKI